MDKLHLGIDIQTLFTFEKNRGIGRYTFHLINALSKKTSDKFIISLFGFEQNPPEEIRNILNNFVSYKQFSLPQPHSLYLDRGVIAPILWNDIASDIDWFLVSSPLMLNILIPDAGPCKIASILYDLIPFLFQGQTKKIDVGHLKQIIYPQHLWERYLARLELIKNYDFFFSISDSTKEAFALEADIPSNKIKTLRCGLGNSFSPNKNQQIYEKLKSSLNLPQHYILTISGFNFRKNIEGGIRIYAKLSDDIKSKFSYLIHCSLSNEEKNIIDNWTRHYGVEGKVIISGGDLSEEELAELYRNAKAFFFPSLYEGLGLPVLEAMASGVPVISSDTSGLSEIIKDAGFAIKPEEEDLFAKKLADLLTDKTLAEKFAQAGLERVKDFSWEKAAETVIDSLIEQDKESIKKLELAIEADRKIPPIKIKPRLAFFSPLNPMHSGIADYSESLLVELRKFFSIDLFVEDYTPSSPSIRENHNIFSYKEFNRVSRNRKYSLHIFNMGNNSLHRIIYKMIRTHPGIVVMHEFSLMGFFRDGLNKSFSPVEIWDLLLSEPERDIENIPDNFVSYLESLNPVDYPLLKDIVRFAKGIIVHSKWLQEKIIKWRKESENKKRIKALEDCKWCDIEVIQMGADAPPEWIKNESITAARKKFHISDDAFVISMVGNITRFKRIEIVLQAFYMFRKKCPNAVLVISGACADIGYHVEIQKMIEAYNFGLSLRMMGYLEMDELIRLIMASDICINLRYPTLGEMSGIIPRIMGLGKPLIVTDIDSFSELPDDVCFKIKVGGGEELEIASIFKQLAENPDVVKKMGKRAKKFVEDCSWEKTAERYRDFILKII